MTKKNFDVVLVEDYGVVVDKEAKLGYHDWYVVDRKLGRVDSRTDWTHMDCPKVIATIGKRIEGLPLIELPDERINAIESILLKISPQLGDIAKRDGGINPLSKRIATEIAAQSKGVYSEEDMIDFTEWWAFEKATWLLAHEGKSTPIPSTKDFLQRWSAQKNKLPVAVELEMEAYNPPEEQHLGVHKHLRVKVTDPETNTIKPADVFYE